MELVNANSEVGRQWQSFLKINQAQTNFIQKIDFTNAIPTITDLDGRRFAIDFVNNKANYHKKKGSIKTELIGKAFGAGRRGLKILDLSAGLGIDAIFLSQLGYEVIALERNPIIYLALQTAWQYLSDKEKETIKFHFSSAQKFLGDPKNSFDAIYFDPMFPEKKKSALPRQEMVFFRNLVGVDPDAKDVLQLAIDSKRAARIVVKRPAKAPELLARPQSQISGKLVRFDIYGVKL